MQLDNSLSQRQGLAQETTADGTRVRYAQRVGSLKLALNFTNQRRGRAGLQRNLCSVGPARQIYQCGQGDNEPSQDGENHGN
jgi:hypothetical protein